jgi:cytochrome c peroxidase
VTCIVIYLTLNLLPSAHGQKAKENAQMIDSLNELPVGLGVLPVLDFPPDNLQTKPKVDLGRRLFFDKILSADRSISCSSSHDPTKGFSDGRPRAIGFQGHGLTRRTPTIWNAASNSSQFWDGRAASLEDQASGPMLSATEMNSPKESELIERLNADSKYRQDFEAAFGGHPTISNVVKAIATYERTVITKDSHFDRYVRGKKNALNVQEKNGLVLFIGKARCARCHDGPNFTDNKFQNIGTGNDEDPGRYSVTHLEQDRGAFKTPGLRNVALHAPYMHNGSAATLEVVIDD